MPRFPDTSPTVAALGGSVYSGLAHRLATHEGETWPFHIGDTWMEPAVGSRMQDLRVEDHPGMHRYASTHGLPDLLDAIVSRTRARTGVAEERDNVLVTAGATGGLAAVIGAMVSPGDEVLILAPHWPLIAGMVQAFHGTSVQVPFFGLVDGSEAAVEAVEAARTERTVALYVNTPNNPTGNRMPEAWLAALTAWAAEHDLWVLSDEVYEDYVYGGEHVYARPLAPERTVSAYSFSKAFGMAGNRAGWMVGPPALLAEARKISTHTWYSTPTAAQLAGIEALTGRGGAWVTRARERYAAIGHEAASRLGVPTPEGSTFLFLDVAHHLDERGLGGFLEDCVDRGLFLAPGPSFGPYPTHVRMCFTATPPDVTRRGIEVLAELLGR